MEEMLVLGIETSCDETAAAIVREDGTVLADIVASQIKITLRMAELFPSLRQGLIFEPSRPSLSVRSRFFQIVSMMYRVSRSHRVQA